MAAKVDITALSEGELLELNRRIIERLRFLRDSKAHHEMLKLNVGDLVAFNPEPGRKVVGRVLRFNRKSVTVVTSEGVQWRVSPTLLTSAEPKDVPAEEVRAEVQAAPSIG